MAMAKVFPWSVEPGGHDMASVNCVLRVIETVYEGNEQRTVVVCFVGFTIRITLLVVCRISFC